MKSSKENILEAVSVYFGISKEMIISLNRKAHIVKARQFYFYLCRELTKETTTSIANYIGRDHATTLHSVNVMKNLLSVYPELKTEIKEVKKVLIEINPIIVSYVNLLELTINYTKSFV